MSRPPLRKKSVFQSTLLMRGATRPEAGIDDRSCYISIHAPHARSDIGRISSTRSRFYFNPRSSCEERHSQRDGRHHDH